LQEISDRSGGVEKFRTRAETGSGGIIAGHGRVLAAHLLNLQRVPTIELAYLSDAQRRAYRIADNKLALNAGWNEELLRLEAGKHLRGLFGRRADARGARALPLHERMVLTAEPDGSLLISPTEPDGQIIAIGDPVSGEVTVLEVELVDGGGNGA
jgi:hypothetical protein